MVRSILLALSFLSIFVCRGECLLWSHEKCESESEHISYNLRTIRPILRLDENSGVTYLKVYKDRGDVSRTININLRVPVLSSLDFICKYKIGKKYPTAVSLCWPKFEVSAHYTSDSMHSGRISASIQLPFPSGGFIVTCSITQNHINEEEIMYQGLCGMTALLWQKDKIVRIVWVNFQVSGIVNRNFGYSKYEPNQFHIETGFARKIWFFRMTLTTGMEWHKSRCFSVFDPFYSVKLEIPINKIFIGLESKTIKGERSWGIGVCLNPTYFE